MATDLTQSNARPESTDVRYSTRALLTVMALSAFVAAIAGPFVRDLTPDERIRAFAACGVWTAMVTAWIFVAARRRLSVEKLAGKVIMRLPIYGTNYRWRRINLWLLSLAIAACGLLGLFVVAGQAILATSLRGAIVSEFYFPSLVMAAVSAQSIVMWWWGHEAAPVGSRHSLGPAVPALGPSEPMVGQRTRNTHILRARSTRRRLAI